MMIKQHPFHEGELAIQKRVRKTVESRINGLTIADRVPPGAAQFIERQSMLVIGSMDVDGKIWVSILFGHPGFLHAEDSRTIILDKASIGLSLDDPLWRNVKHNVQVGLLLIGFESRQRLRVNGRMQSVSSRHFSIEIDQAYPNCPKYIQRRYLKVSDEQITISAELETHGAVLDEAQQALIRHSDTFFVASSHPEHGMDASHRGGQPGFVQIKNNTCLRVPDYEGNNLFNTLGNFQSYPFAGLVFIDFQQQRLLQLTGQVEILWDLQDPDDTSGGTKRFWEFEIQSWRESQISLAISWEFLDYSPFNPKSSKKPVNQDLLLRVEKITQLTPGIKSFMLRDTENKSLPAFEPGAHLPLKVITPDDTEAMRQYSLVSDFRDRSNYEIAVLEESQGRGGSLYLHHDIREGDILQAKVPKNDFPMAEKVKHNVLIAGGIGVTPIISMLRSLSLQKQSLEMHYAARTHADFAFLDMIKSLAGNKLFCYTSQEKNANSLDLQAVLAVPKADTHVYVCGPRGMIEAVRNIAETNGWVPEKIHFESFCAKTTIDDKPIIVHLNKSQKMIQVPANRSILETLLNRGIDVPHQCKRGECSMCMTRVLSGEPDHRDLCLAEEQRKTSMCICVSRARDEELSLEL